MPAERHHVLILNQYAPPEMASTGRFAYEIAAAIAAAGHRVTFVAGQPSYLPDQPAAPARELLGGVDIRRLRICGSGGRRTRAARFLGYLTFLVRALITSVKLIRTESVQTIVCFHNPPFLAVVGALLSGERRRFICIVQDIHPDVLVATEWLSLPGPVTAAWERINRWAYSRASRVVVISADMRDVLIGKGLEPEQVVSIPIWAEPELAPVPGDPAARAEFGLDAEELLVLFTGNMGVTQRLEPVFAAAELLAGESVRFCFTGGGIHAARWKQASAQLPNVTFLPFQPEPGYRRLVATCDIGLVTLNQSVERLVVPSRAFPLLSAGVPLVAVMSADCELGRLVRDWDAGACVQQPEALAAAIRGWLSDRAALRRAGENARAAYVATRDRGALVRRYVELAESPTPSAGGITPDS